ncbi:MAG: ABC transporter permease, partial [Acidobacteria bacterium]|nr:ABC transporter permease [Acidobacteriota bacterium]
MLWSRIHSLFKAIRHRARFENEMTSELQFHIEARAQDLMSRNGLSPQEALRRARIEFGSIEKFKEESRRARGLKLLDDMSADLTYAVRQWRQNPTFTTVAILTLALGIGLNTAAFTAMNDAILKKLSVPKPDQLRQLQWTSPNAGFRTGGNSLLPSSSNYSTSFSYPAFQYMRNRTTSFQELFCQYMIQDMNVVIRGQAEIAKALLVSGNYLKGFGVHARLGRILLPEDDNPIAEPAVMLSHAFWQRVFNGDAAVIGKTIVLNRMPVSIIGVLPEDFYSADPDWRPDLMVPLEMQPRLSKTHRLHDARYWSFLVLGRLRPEISDEQARLESEVLLNQAIQSDPPEQPYDPPRVALISAARGFSDSNAYELPNQVLMTGAVGFVLLIVCSNLAGLWLSRATARGREIGTRLAVGASRSRVIRQLLTESILLSFIGGSLGVAVAYLAADELPKPDVNVLLFVAGITLSSGVLFGIAPAVYATRVDLLALLKLSTSKSGPVRLRLRKTLVAFQVATSLILLVGAGLFVRTLASVESEAIGFNPDNLLVFRMDPTLSGYADVRLRDFAETALKRVQALPAVQAASFSRWGVLMFSSSGDDVCVPGHERVGVATHYVAPQFFRTMQIPQLAGRDFEWGDREGAARVVIVNETFAKRYYDSANPLGARFMIGSDCA